MSLDLTPVGPEVIDTGPKIEFGDVPDAGPDATVDPHWLELRGGSLLPAVYMPPAMPGPRRRPTWLRVMAVVLVAVFLGATAAGVCLTYGPPHGWF